eukprot:SAG31_NODE_23138_length_510_cov_1.116788_1_plen_90_part_00
MLLNTAAALVSAAGAYFLIEYRIMHDRSRTSSWLFFFVAAAVFVACVLGAVGSAVGSAKLLRAYTFALLLAMVSSMCTTQASIASLKRC